MTHQPRMKITIVGAGAIGGWLAARLASAGQPPSLLARGATLQALRRDGLRLDSAEGSQTHRLLAEDDPQRLGRQDLVVIALKSQALPTVAPTLSPLIGPDTTLLTMMNGVPAWFLQGVEGPPGLDAPLQSVDPDGRVSAALPVKQLVAGVVHVSATNVAPGHVRHSFNDQLIVGDAPSGAGPRAQAVAALLQSAGLRVELHPRIREAIWYKLWGNLTMNPVSALTRATMDRILDDPLVRKTCSRAMREAAAIGEHMGCRIDQEPEDRHRITMTLGPVRTSMLQDMEAGRELELDALVGAVREIGERVGVGTPTIDALHGLARLAAASRRTNAS